MGFARCGVEGNLRNILKIPAKNLFRFHFFCNLVSGKRFLLEIGSPPDFQFAVARTSQSPFPLSAISPKQRTKLWILVRFQLTGGENLTKNLIPIRRP